MPARPTQTFIILGASYTTGNRGVDALLSGTIVSIQEAVPDARIVLLDYERQPAIFNVPGPDGETAVRLTNLRFSWKLFLPNNVFRLLAVASLLRLIPSQSLRTRLISRNPWLQEIQSARLILSLAGGDSFSDIYGLRRFLYIVLPQFLVLALRRPLVLLPQTLGPFDGLCAKVVGRALMSCAEAVYSRDEESLRVARKLLGHRTAHLRFSPDMAFALPPQAPRDGIPEWLVQRDNNRPLVGLNVSGLLHIGGYTNDNMFGVRANYRELMMKLVLWFTREQHADVVLVSHVVGPKSGAENDAPACQELYDRAKGLCGGRLHLASPDYDHREIKYLIGRCDFFLGSRMHATIAALSQCVPAIGLAYSRKFMGVFRTVDVASLVVDLREHDEAAVLAKVKSAFAARSEHRRRLQATTRPIAEAARTLVGTLLHEAAATARQPVDGATLASAPSSRPLVV